MRLSAVDTISPSTLPASLPLHLEQKPSTTSNLMQLLIVLPATIALLMPFLILAEAYAANPAVRVAMAGKPQALAQIAMALAFWLVLFAWPLKRLAESLISRRVVDIAAGKVRITERTLRGTSVTTVPLGDYSGVVHHVRASLSGLRHELILAHPEHNRTVLLAISSRFSQADIDGVSAMLGLSELPTATIYRNRTRTGALAAVGAESAMLAGAA